MITANFKKVGSRNSQSVNLQLPYDFIILIKDFTIDIIEIDDTHTIHIVDKNNNDILSYTIKDFKNNSKLNHGFQTIYNKLKILLGETTK